MFPNCLCCVSGAMEKIRKAIDLRVKCTKYVCDYEPLLARWGEILVFATRLFTYAIECDRAVDRAVDALASNLDNLLLVLAQFDHLHVPVCKGLAVWGWRVVLRGARAPWRWRRELQNMTRELEIRSQHHVEATIVLGANTGNVEIGRGVLAVVPGKLGRK